MFHAPVVLVTGSGKRRVGWHIAQALAERGYRLAIHYHTSASEAEATVAQLCSRGVDAVPFAADLTSEEATRGLILAVLRQFGRLDVLINCAAIWKAKKFEEITAAEVRQNFEVNVLGTFVCAQQAGLAMIKQPEGGCIVNFGDWAEARPYPNYAAYFATKGAIPALSRCLAVELGTRHPKVRVNCILPGPVMIPDDMPVEERQQAIAATLVQREGTPRNIAQTVLFLIDNDFITGAVIPVDGGRTVYARGY